MANIHVDAQPLIAKTTGYPATIGEAPAKIRAAKAKAPQISGALEAMAGALTNVQGSLNALHSAARHNTQAVQQIYVTDNTGKVIAAIGDFEYQGVVTPNYFSEIHVGDPLNTGNPALALFNAANGKVTIGQNGAIEVLDPFGNDAAWIGTEPDTEPVTGAADNGSGLIRLTMTGHTYVTGDTPTFTDVGGVPNATGIFTVTVIDANTVDLQNSVFVGTYTSGGTGTRILHISGAANNGSGLIRITIATHDYETGDEVNIPILPGVPSGVGQWVITVIDANNFDLQGSTFAGTYTSGGTCLRYFAGMLAQTIAIGPSFPNYKLRAFADGSLKIQNAEIILSSGSNEIILDPSGPLFEVTNGTWTLKIDPTDGFLFNSPTGPHAITVAIDSTDSFKVSNGTESTSISYGGIFHTNDRSNPEQFGDGGMAVSGLNSSSFGVSCAETLTSDATMFLQGLASGVLFEVICTHLGATKVMIDGAQVLHDQMAAVTAPSGGGTTVSAPSGGTVVDVQARAAIVSIISAISGSGNTVDPNARTAIDGILGVLSLAAGGHGLTA